jgi:hypothetical protein
MPRARTLTEAKQREICHLVVTGCSIEAAARHVCCSVKTIRREALRNPQFHEQLRAASVSARITPLRTMRTAALSDWRAAAWLLERTDPHHYAKRSPHAFSEAEVADLVGRVCEVFRAELCDKQAFARAKRRVATIARAAIAKTTKVAPPREIPIIDTDVHADDPSAIAASHAAAAPPEPANETKSIETKRPHGLIRMSDMKPYKSSPATPVAPN